MGIARLFFRQQNKVETLYNEYIGQWRLCTQNFASASQVFLKVGNGQTFSFWCETTHKSESKADDLRRNIEYLLYSKALLPESRRDILEILESTDKILNKIESVLFQIHLENIALPEPIKPFFERMFKITIECLKVADQAVSGYFSRQDNILELCKEIDTKESECDHVEREALRTLFNEDFPWHTRLQLKNLIIEIGNITDRIESVADRLVIHSVKRRV